MRTNQWITALSTVFALTAAGQAVAEVGIMDGADSFKDFQSFKSRAEVRSELSGSRAPAAPMSSGSSRNDEPASGAYGVGGARYSTQNLEDGRGNVSHPHQLRQPNMPGDIYFGG
ncbi:hypothetical protein [Noviherbaspirillum saxi]|nr:hypothetical protein [Noviherbaspirillum saxi]